MEETKPIAKPGIKKRTPLINIALFFATLATTWLAGAGGADLQDAVANGFVFMGSIIGILLSHEMGHYIMARRNGVDASLPYFLPFPIGPIGTFGAVIVMRGRIRSANALMEIGAAGPLAGIAVALPILLIGLSNSPIMALPPPGSEVIMEGQSIIYLFLKWIAVGHIPPGSDVNLHPMAWAGWVGLFVTTLNLLPIGQLDGGHIFYALWPKNHAAVSRIFFRSLFVLGLVVVSFETYSAFKAGFEGSAFVISAMTGSQWLFMGLLLFFFFGRKKGRGFKHPPVNTPELSPIHRAVGYLCILIFLLTFAPVPIRGVVPPIF